MTVFNADAVANPLETLVGEGKKYANEAELAKAYLHAETAIEQRNRELAELREDLNARVAVEEAIQKLQRTAPTPQTPQPEAHQPAKPAEIKPEDLAELVRQELERQNQSKKIQTNVDTVAAKLTSIYGDEDKANQVVRTKAAELGVSVEWLQQVAAQSPKAFFTTIGVSDQAPPPPPGPTHGNVNPQALAVNNSTVKPNTYAWYQQLRKDNPKAYHDPKTQNQMHKDAQANPETFFA